ncbi:hypothetical protein VYU27_002207 [Nannochloropsis oceanica]
MLPSRPKRNAAGRRPPLATSPSLNVVLVLLLICYSSSCCEAFAFFCGDGNSIRSLMDFTRTAKAPSTRTSDVVWGARPASAAQQRSRRSGMLAMKVKFDAKQDYYGRLNIDKTASLNDIKRAYRRLALQTHPDVNKAPDASETFKRVCEAYKVLSDAEARKGYDLARGMHGGGYSSRWGSGAAGRGSTSSSSSSRTWYDQYDPSGFGGRRPGANEDTRESIDDSFSSIFRDFVGGVASKGGRGVLEDVVEFLENSVDGFGEESNAEFEEILKSDDLTLVQEEIENLNFLIPKLREKQQQAKIDMMVAKGKLRTLQSAAAARDMAAVDKQLEAVERVAAMQARVQDLDGHMKRADKRQRRLMLRAEELRWGMGGRSAYSKYASPGAKGSASSRTNTAGSAGSAAAAAGGGGGGAGRSVAGGGGSGGKGGGGGGGVEEELQKLKKQMGL